jgi:NAD(P)H-hydrate repair Nnr-like enzyme with NAD(P)H-hydrate epimerase domain
VLGAPILSHSEKKMQHLCQLFLTLEYRVWVCRNTIKACLATKNRSNHAVVDAVFGTGGVVNAAVEAS